MATQYPECEKLASVKEKSQELGEFLEWLKRKYELCTWEQEDGDDVLCPARVTTESILAEYFGIDMTKVEEEHRAMLASLQGEEDELQNGN